MDNKVELGPLQTSANTYLYASLVSLYYQSLNDLDAPQQLQGSNAFTSLAVTAFVTAAATWEAHLNFVFFSPWTRLLLGDETHVKLKPLHDALDKLSTVEKTHALPLIAFNKTFDRGQLPFQDLDVLFGIRNAIVHNYMQRSPRNYVQRLSSRGVQLKATPHRLSSWIEDISTLESIRWCINLLGELDAELHAISPSSSPHWKRSFPLFPITESNKLIKKRFEGNMFTRYGEGRALA